MAIDPQYPGNVARDVALELVHRRGKLVHLELTGRVEIGRALGKQNLRLEYEAVADHQDAGTLAQDLPQAPKELGAVARQFLNPLGERRIESLAKIDDLRLACDIALLGIGKEARQLADLTPERSDLLVQQLDLGERVGRNLFFLVERSAQPADCGAGFRAF